MQLEYNNIIQALADDNVDLLQSICCEHSDLFCKFINEKSGDNFAHIAARFGSINCLKYITKSKSGAALLHQYNLDRKVPLHDAAQHLQILCVELILSIEGCDVDVLKRADWTPLMLAAAKSGSIDTCRLLLNAGANPRLRNKDGWTPFHIAVREGDISVIKLFLEHDALLWDTKSNNGRTPLHTAALHGLDDVVKLLLSFGKNPKDEVDSCGMTPLMEAVKSNSIPTVRLLLDKNYDPIKPFGAKLQNCIHVGAESGSVDILEFLVNRIDTIDCSATINGKTSSGETPLHYAAKEGHVGTVTWLIQHGADKNSIDYNGRSPRSLVFNNNRLSENIKTELITLLD